MSSLVRWLARRLDLWRDRWRDKRDRLVADPAFQRRAAAFPLTRPIARQRARALFDLCAGFVYSQVLLACVRLRLFEILADGPKSPENLAERLGLSLDSTRLLLDAATSLRLTEARGGKGFGLGRHGAALLGNAGVMAMIEHHALVYADLADPVAMLRGERDTGLARYWPYAGADTAAALTPDEVAPYTDLMAASQPIIAADLVGAYPFARHRCLMDVGGGDGSFLIKVAEHAPSLRLILFDLPSVAERARARFAAAGLRDRASAEGGDFRSGPLPQGADIVSLVRILHDHDDVTVLALLRAVRAILPPGGRLLVAEPMSGAGPIGGAYFGFYLRAMGRGRPRSPEELEALLRDAGFAAIRRVATHVPFLIRLIEARA